MKDAFSPKFDELLRECGLKATSRRRMVLHALAAEKSPLSAAAIHRKLRQRMDLATVYRTLLTLTGAGIVHEVNLRHAHAHYELRAGREHHHHVVCTGCGKVADVGLCASGLEKKALKAVRGFASVDEHALEFFGTCKNCA
jgi:Fe2+ or Zn2+ uptake regulation protein